MDPKYKVNAPSLPESFCLGGTCSYKYQRKLGNFPIRHKPGSWQSSHTFSSPTVKKGAGAYKRETPTKIPFEGQLKGEGSFRASSTNTPPKASLSSKTQGSFVSEFDSSARWGAVSAGIDITRGIINYNTRSNLKQYGPPGLEVPTDAQLQDRVNNQSSQLDSILDIAGGVATLGALFL
jgi:hypothetical protein